MALESVFHPEGNRFSDLFGVTGRKYWNDNWLRYSVLFNNSALCSAPIDPQIWNKLVYLGSLTPSQNGANFGWRYWNGNLSLCVRFNVDGNRHDPDNTDFPLTWSTNIQPNVTYVLEQWHSGSLWYWSFNNQIVWQDIFDISDDWLSTPWFGGGEGNRYEGNVPPQDIQIWVEFLPKLNG